MPRSFISEDDIEKSILKKIKDEQLGYSFLELDPSPEKIDLLPDGTGRRGIQAPPPQREIRCWSADSQRTYPVRRSGWSIWPRLRTHGR